MSAVIRTRDACVVVVSESRCLAIDAGVPVSVAVWWDGLVLARVLRSGVSRALRHVIFWMRTVLVRTAVR